MSFEFGNILKILIRNFDEDDKNLINIIKLNLEIGGKTRVFRM